MSRLLLCLLSSAALAQAITQAPPSVATGWAVAPAAAPARARVAVRAHPQPSSDPPKIWSGRFSEPVSEVVKRYTSSVALDQRMASQDIAGSRAHAAMLARQGIITPADLDHIERGLDQVAAEIADGRFAWSLDAEDVHLNIEQRLTALVGDAGKRLHTGRSRIDQVATDLRLWLRDAIDEILSLIGAFQGQLVDLAEAHADTPMPGFTHLQVAQPITFGHHLLAYYEMSARDADRLVDCRRRLNQLPLGAAALAGTSFPIDRESVARQLAFAGVCQNSLDAVSDRDFAVEFLAAAAMLMVHLSRLSEEIVLWMSPPFAFVDLDDRFCTRSSIMPQKKNPDVPEMVRSKTGRVTGALLALLTRIKAQPLAYNKDNQEDKEQLFGAVDTVVDTLRIYTEMIPGIRVQPGAMRAALARGFATATDLADYLVKRGLPFRDADEAAAVAVRGAVERGCDLADLGRAELAEMMGGVQGAAERIGDDVLDVLTIEGSLASRDHVGGTAPTQVRAQIARIRGLLGEAAPEMPEDAAAEQRYRELFFRNTLGGM